MRILALLFALISFTQVQSQIVVNFPYLEDFENGPGNWFTPISNSVWEFGTPNKVQINGAYSGNNAWCTGLSGNYPNNRLQALESPLFRFSSLTNAPYIRFKYFIQTESCCDVLRLEYSLDDQNWVPVGEFNTGQNWYNDSTVSHWSGNSNGWKIASHRLDDLPQAQDLRFRFRFFSDHNQSGEGVAIDDIEIVESYSDLEIREIISPISSACSYPSNSDVTISLQNLGQSQVNNITLNYSFGTDTVSEILSSLDTATITNYTFNQKVNLSQDSIYNFTTWLSVASDNELVNNSISGNAINLNEISQFPYSENFEGNTDAWLSDGVNSSWSLGRPNKQTIRGANSDTTAWVTGNTGFGFYNDDESSFVLSPCFNTTALNSAQLRLSVWWESESDFDGANIEYTTNDGLTWNLLNNPNGINWYNKTNVDALNGPGWSGNDNFNDGSNSFVNAAISEAQLAGNSSLRFRINFASDVNTRDDGFAFDDISLLSSAATDLAVDRLSQSSFDLCQFGTGDSLWVYFTNFGSSALNSFSINYEINAQSGIANYSGSLGVGNTDSLFLTTVPTSDTGSFEVLVYADLMNDGFRLNDTVRATLNVYTQKDSPTSFDVQICDSSRALLTATGGGLHKWYTDAALTDLVYVGETFLTGDITSDSTFYVTNSNGVYDTIGAPIIGIGTGSYTNVTSLTRIEVSSFTTIATAYYYCQSSGEFKVSIQDLNGNVLETKTVVARAAGKRRVQLGFDLTPGTYDLKVHDFNGLLLFRNTSGADYENYANNHVALIGNNFDPEFYYYLYEIQVVESEPCPGIDSVRVTRANVAPVANYTFDQKQNRLFLYNTSGSGQNFTWIFENISTGSVDSSNVLNPEIFLDSGSYNIKLIARNNCGSDTLTRSFQVDEISAVEIQITDQEFNLSLYPNPTRSLLNWRIEQDIEEVEIRVINLLGREVFSATANTSFGNIDVSTLEKGYYILLVSGEKATAKKAFIVE